MTDVIYPVDLTNGTNADADQVMDNFNAIKGVVEGQLTRENLDPSLSNALFIPAGVIVDFGGSTAPDGWLLCDGSSVARTTFSDLFAVLGTTYGAADGAHFTLPDFRGRVSVMEDGAGGRLTANDARGNSGGEEKHTLSSGEMPSHTHTGTTGTDSVQHHHDIVRASGAGGDTTGQGVPPHNGATAGTAAGPGASTLHTHSFTTASAGSGASHNNMQPYLVATRIIKT